MLRKRSVLAVLVCAGLAVGCASTSPTATVQPSDGPLVTVLPSEAGTASSSPVAGSTPDPRIPTLDAEGPLEAGTYRLNKLILGGRYKDMLITVPAGWNFGGWLVNRPRPDHDIPPVAVQFWNVDLLYRHPCRRTDLFNPGPSVDDLANALVDIPLRSATDPVDVSLDGYAGKYVEWSVPADMEMDEDGNFPDCDLAGDGNRYFESWTGLGAAGGRYHQGPGQLDRVWIIDVDGTRVVIDAFSMPYATEHEIAELVEVVESIRFER